MSSKKRPVMSMALLTGGAAVGAGILGMPVQTGLAGFWPTVVGLIFFAIAIWINAWIISEGFIRYGVKDKDLAWLYHKELGLIGRWFMIIGYFVNFYGALVAYLSGAGAIFTSLIGWEGYRSLFALGFFLPATTLLLFGANVVRRSNVIFMIVLGISFFYMIWKCWSGIVPEHFSYVNWSYLPAVTPIIMCSLAYHNMVPLVCNSLNLERALILKALGIGTLIPLVLCILFSMVSVGILPLEGKDASLISAFLADQPATVPIAQRLKTPDILITGSFFSLFAILTSYLAVGLALMRFWKDLWQTSKKWYRVIVTFLPPIIIVSIWPNIFLKSLEIAAGLGLSLVFGIAPAIMLIRWKHPLLLVRLTAWFLLLLFTGIFFLVVFQSLGWLNFSLKVD